MKKRKKRKKNTRRKNLASQHNFTSKTLAIFRANIQHQCHISLESLSHKIMMTGSSLSCYKDIYIFSSQWVGERFDNDVSTCAIAQADGERDTEACKNFRTHSPHTPTRGGRGGGVEGAKGTRRTSSATKRPFLFDHFDFNGTGVPVGVPGDTQSNTERLRIGKR